MFSENNLKLINELKKDNSYYEYKEIPGKGLCCLNDFAFTTGIMIGLDELGYYGRYCYPNKQEAIENFKNWDGNGDPKGNWVKYKGTGGERSNDNCEVCNELCNSKK
jgi:hypothetical protein